MDGKALSEDESDLELEIVHILQQIYICVDAIFCRILLFFATNHVKYKIDDSNSPIWSILTSCTRPAIFDSAAE